MRIPRPTFRALLLSSVLLLLGAGSGARAGDVAKEPPPPQRYPMDLLKQYAALGDSGGQALAQGHAADAARIFESQIKLIPGAGLARYSLACAHVRLGQTDKALDEFSKLVDEGFDDSDRLEANPDLASLRDNPKFKELVERAGRNTDLHLAYLANGLPHRDPVAGITRLDSLKTWFESERQQIMAQRPIWFNWQGLQAELDLETRALETNRALADSSSHFEYPLGRLRILATLRSIYETWGPVADGTQKEATACLAGNPSPNGRNLAQFFLGVSLFCKAHPAPVDPGWKEAVAAARPQFAKVDPSGNLGPAASAWILYFDLGDAGDKKADLYPRIKELVTDHWNDSATREVASTFFKDEVLRAYWPIPISATDLDGKPVSLDDYKGKLLLIDFWATWCQPCRSELPGLVDAYKQFHDRGLEVLSISLDYARSTTADDYRSFATKAGMAWRHVYDGQSWSSPLVKGFFVYSIPNPILVGRDGTLLASGDELRGAKLAQTLKQSL